MRVIYIGSEGSPNQTKAFGHPLIKGEASDLPDHIAEKLQNNPSFHVGDGDPPEPAKIKEVEVEDVVTSQTLSDVEATIKNKNSEISGYLTEISVLEADNEALKSAEKERLEDWKEAEKEYKAKIKELEDNIEELTKPKPTGKPNAKK